jgi:hypothetical protein
MTCRLVHVAATAALGAALMWPLSSAGQMPLAPRDSRATVEEALALPRFCWNQYLGYEGPEYSLPPRQVCGVYTNHYCPGLIALNRANRAVNDNAKRRWLAASRGEFQYTVRHTTKYPDCPLRIDAQSKLRQIDVYQKIFGRYGR